MTTALPCPVPHGATARRLDWRYLPPLVRHTVERRCGSPVVEAHSQGAGFTPGFASVLRCADGSRHFVKAASVLAQRPFAQAYRDEARVLGRLPSGVPAPALQWVEEVDDWVVLGIEHVAARTPARPWAPVDLGRALDTLAETARVLTPAPSGMGLATVAAELGGLAQRWEDLPDAAGENDATPGLVEHRDEAAALAADFAGASRGDTVVHTDVRDDNVLLAEDGRTLLCDWNWPARGAAWIDTVSLMIGARGDGLDVEEVLRTSHLTRDVDPADVDAFLALVCGYFLTSAAQPVPTSSPHLRAAQRWQGEVCWAWLRERRGWS